MGHDLLFSPINWGVLKVSCSRTHHGKVSFELMSSCCTVQHKNSEHLLVSACSMKKWHKYLLIVINFVLYVTFIIHQLTRTDNHSHHPGSRSPRLPAYSSHPVVRSLGSYSPPPCCRTVVGPHPHHCKSYCPFRWCMRAVVVAGKQD